MLELADDPAFAREVVLHAWATKYLTIAGFTVLLWDHACTFEDEVRFMWPAPKSLVKGLFLGNRYITPIFQAITVYQMTRVADFSDTFCKIWTLINGFAEIASMASLDLLLLFRLHALWGGQRKIVLGTFALYFFAYSCLIAAGVKSAIDLTPHMSYSKLAKMCSSDYRPKLMSALWAFALFSEAIVFVMTTIKAIEHRRSNEVQPPLLKSLYRDQFFYYVTIIFVRTFNLVIWNFLPPSLLFLGVFFIWALVTAVVSRMMLNLRSVACANTQTSPTFFGETPYSTRIVWARRNDGLDSSLRTISPDEPFGGQNDDEEGGEPIRLQEFRRREIQNV